MNNMAKKVTQWGPEVMFRYVDGVHDEMLKHVSGATDVNNIIYDGEISVKDAIDELYQREEHEYATKDDINNLFK